MRLRVLEILILLLKFVKNGAFSLKFDILGINFSERKKIFLQYFDS